MQTSVLSRRKSETSCFLWRRFLSCRILSIWLSNALATSRPRKSPRSLHPSTASTSPRTLSSWSPVRPVPCNPSLLSPHLPVSSFSPEPSTSPRRERKTRSGRVPPPTPSSSFQKCCSNSSTPPGKAFSYRSSLILVDHCTRSHQRGDPRVHPAFPALLGAAQNRVEFGQHAAQPDSTRSPL